MKKPILYISALMLVLLMFSCKKEVTDQSQNGSVTFGLQFSQDLLKSLSADSISAVVISVENSGGQSVLNDKQVKLYNMNGTYISEPLVFDPGTYKLTKFLVIDRNGNVIYAAPLRGSSKAYLVSQPLPMDFTVTSNNITKISPEVLPTANAQAKDFGYSSFSFIIVNAISFKINVFAYDTVSHNLAFTTANLLISADSLQNTIISKTITPSNDTIVLSDLERKYIFMITKDGYNPWIDTLTTTQLRNYSLGNPLAVVLERQQTITFLLPKVQVVFPTVDLTLKGTGTFMIFRGNSDIPVARFTLTGTGDQAQINLTCVDDPGITIKGNIDKLTDFIVGSPFPGRLGMLQIDLSQAINLKKLVLYSTFLKTIDLSRNTELRELEIDATTRNECEIDSLNLSHNPKLNKLSFTNLILKHVVWSNVASDCLNQFYVDLLSSVLAYPRTGNVLSPTPTGNGLTAKESLVHDHGWTVTNY